MLSQSSHEQDAIQHPTFPIPLDCTRRVRGRRFRRWSVRSGEICCRRSAGRGNHVIFLAGVLVIQDARRPAALRMRAIITEHSKP